MPEVEPQPTPTLWGFDAVPGHVVLVAQTPLGTFVHFIQVDNVDAVCEALQQQKAKARGQGQLLIPQNVMFGPDGSMVKPVPMSPEVAEQAEKASTNSLCNAQLGDDDPTPGGWCNKPLGHLGNHGRMAP